MSVLEKLYIVAFRGVKTALNPVKKRIMKTECEVHKFINNQSIVILRNDGFRAAYRQLATYIRDINAGVVWADQDLKSSNHFYNPHTLKGLYGNSNAKRECMNYYQKALDAYRQKDVHCAMFYLGAACHLIQDMTVPQHANVRLFNNHRGYEKWVVRMHRHHDEFKIYDGGIYLNTVKGYIDMNSRKAIHTHWRYCHISDKDKRFYKITSKVLTMAQKTTAGLMVKFFSDIEKTKRFKIKRSLLFSH